MKKLVETFKFWLRVRRLNKALLAEAKKAKTAGAYEPPTRQEVLDFVNDGKVGAFNFGKQRFRHMISPVGNQNHEYTNF